MMRVWFVLFMSLVGPSVVWGGELTLQAAQVHNGEVAVVRWTGQPLVSGAVRFRDRVIALYADVDGAIALLPVGLNVEPGEYPLSAVLVDHQGETHSPQLSLQVIRLERPLERLTLPERMVTPQGKPLLERIARESALLKDAFAGHSLRLWTGFQRPVDDPIASIFGKRRLLNGKPKSPHSGTDFRSPLGTSIKSISNGRVILVGDFFYTGRTVVVDHGEGLFSLYAHLSRVTADVGDELLPGQEVGKVGSTGRSTGAHLHLTVKLLGERVDPMALIQALSVSRT